jgi:hypothetical protein
MKTDLWIAIALGMGALIIIGLLAVLSHKQKRANARRTLDITTGAYKDCYDMMMAAVADGLYTDEEDKAIRSTFASRGLTPDDVSLIRSRVMVAALDAVKSDGVVSRQEQESIERLAATLQIPSQELAVTRAELAKLRVISDLEQGIVPEVDTAGVALQKGEVAIWREKAKLLEDRVVRREYQGGSRGVSIRIMKGLSYRVGATRGQSVPVTETVEVASGHLFITTKHIIFSGDAKSFRVKLEKIIDVTLYNDGMRFAADGKVKPHLLSTRNGAGDLLGAALTLATKMAG